MKTLYLMCGPAACGKTTYIEKYKKENDIVISRDAIRFSLLEETDGYFDKEKQVFSEYVKLAIAALNNETGGNVWLDATHINEASRWKILNRLPKNCELVAVNFLASFEGCVKRNCLRTGRMQVPREVILDMIKKQTFASPQELKKFNFDNVVILNIKVDE